MSNRGRHLVSSYLTETISIDWRRSAQCFEHWLIDHDPESNCGNWLYEAGAGNDSRPSRVFNPKLQADKYGTDGGVMSMSGIGYPC